MYEYVAIAVALAALAAINLPALTRTIADRLQSTSSDTDTSQADEPQSRDQCWSKEDVEALRQLTRRAEMLNCPDFSAGLDLVKEHYWPRQERAEKQPAAKTDA